MRLRDGARAIVLDEADRILLVQFTFPDLSLWGTPGGGIDAGEGHEQAIIRELMEETGLEGIELGPWVWSRTHIFPSPDGRWDGQRDRFFLVRTRSSSRRRSSVRRSSSSSTSRRFAGGRRRSSRPPRSSSRRGGFPSSSRSSCAAGPPHEPLDVGD